MKNTMMLGLALTLGTMTASADPWANTRPNPTDTTDTTKDNSTTPADPNKDKGADVTEQEFEYTNGQNHLGVMVMGMTQDLRVFFKAPNDQGVLVAKVEKDSAADRAGIRVGDVLTGVDGKPVKSSADVLEAIGNQQGGDVKLEVIRQGETTPLTASLPQKDQPKEPAKDNTDDSIGT